VSAKPVFEWYRKLFAKKDAIPVWDGNPKKLPPKGQQFLYNDQTFIWRTCDCGNRKCRRPSGYDVNGQENPAMTFRLRGNNQGENILTVLYKLGKIEETAKALEDHKTGIDHLLNDDLGEIKDKVCGGSFSPKVDSYLASRGISTNEILKATFEAIGGDPSDIDILEIIINL